MQLYKDRLNERGRYATVLFFNRENGETKTVDISGKSLSMIGWDQDAAGLRVVLMTNRWGTDRSGKQETFVVDPKTGKWEQSDQLHPLFLKADLRSPDGKVQFEIGKGELPLSENATR